MEQKIKIQGMPSTADPLRCAFQIDRPVYPNRSFHFTEPEKANGSPLAEGILMIPGVKSVLVSHDTVTVFAEKPVEWQVIGKEIGLKIRAVLESSVKPIANDLEKHLPSPEVIREVVTHLLDSQINPQVAEHGGIVRLLDVKENVVLIEMGGGCQGCGQANATLRGGVEKLIREMLPEVGEIVDATDHAAGENPYYRSGK